MSDLMTKSNITEICETLNVQSNVFYWIILHPNHKLICMKAF